MTINNFPLYVITLFVLLLNVEANGLNENLVGSGCVISPESYNKGSITFSAADLVKEFGIIPPKTQVIYTVNFSYSLGAIDASCADANFAISLEPVNLPNTNSLSFDSLILNRNITNTAQAIENHGNLTLSLALTVHTPLGEESIFTYVIPFTMKVIGTPEDLYYK